MLDTWDYEDIKGLSKKAFMDEGVPRVREVFTTPDTALTSLKEFIPDFINQLTRPLTEEEKWSGTYKPPVPPSIAMTGTWDEVQAYCEGDLSRLLFVSPVALMNDVLPVTPPTEERVAKMLTGTSHTPDEVIEIREMGPLGPGEVEWIATVEKVAINAVMAGCKPEHMPVLLAMAELRLPKGGTTDCSAGQMYVVSGPIAKEIGMNSGIQLLSPGNPANMALGRAAALMGINLAGCMMGLTTIGRHGNNIWGLTFAESEKSPWEGLNVDEGYGAGESALISFGGFVQLMPACTGNVKTPTNLFEYQNASPEHLVAALKTCKAAVVLFTPDTAKAWKERYGFTSIEQLQDYLWDNLTWTRGEWGSHYTFYMSSVRVKRNPQGSRMLNPDHLDAPDDALVPMIVNGPKSIKVIVAGGDGYAWGWGGGWAPTSTSIDKWR